MAEEDQRKLDAAAATIGQLRSALERIKKHCSYTRDEHDPLVTAGLIASDALANAEGVLPTLITEDESARRSREAAVMFYRRFFASREIEPDDERNLDHIIEQVQKGKV